MSLRPAAAADCTALTRMMHASRAYDGAYRAHGLALRLSREDLARNVVRVQEEDGEPRGFYSLIAGPDACELDLIFVADAFQRRGIGRALFADMAATARARGYAGVLIVSHPPAAGFYERMGARQVGIEPPRASAAWPRPRFWFALER